jgi:6-phosphogluconolactonase
MFELLSDGPMDWSRTSMFQVDERIAPTGSPERNLTHLVLSLPLACQSAIRPMPVGADDLEAAAREYEYSLPERLDLVHLGLGPDGHTASLVPGDPVLEVADRSVALTGGEYQGRRRMTLTYPALDRARSIFFLVLGDDKREAFGKLLAGDRSIPAGRVAAERMVLITDLDVAQAQP